MTAAWLSALHPEYNMEFYNRGVGGDRIWNLRYRSKKNRLDLRPNLVSILMGVNDFNRKATPTESFKSDYTNILEQTRQSKCQIVLLEPFLFIPAEFSSNSEELNKKIEVVRELSREFDAKLIPLNDIFMKTSIKRVPSFWSLDGAHPTLLRGTL